MTNVPDDDKLVADLVALWHQTRAWAEQLLSDTFDLSDANEFLPTIAYSDIPRSGQFPDSPWLYRVHGIGIDVAKSNNCGGIDFDFDKPNVDRWRLREFMVKQLNDGAIPMRYYRPLLQDADRWSSAMDAAGVA